MSHTDLIFLVALVLLIAIHLSLLIPYLKDRAARRARDRADGKRWAQAALLTHGEDFVRSRVAVVDRTAFEEGVEEALREHYEANPHLDH